MSRSSELAVRATAAPRPKPEAGAPLAPGRHLTDHVFHMRWTKRRGWLGMTIAGRDELPPLRPTSPALNYGQTVIDGLMAYRMQDGAISVFRPDSHIKRLNNGARRLALPQVDFDRMWSAIRRLVGIDQDWIPGGPGSGLYLRLVLAGESTTLGLGPAEECLCYLLASPVTAPEPPGTPVSALVIESYARAWPGGTGDITAAGNYGTSLVPAEIAVNYGYDHVLWLDGPEQRFVTQVGPMNVFFVIDGVLTTPALTDCVLPGITRDSVIKLARDAGTRVEERPVDRADVLTGIAAGRVTECFGTATATGIVAVSCLGHRGAKHEIPDQAPGPVAAHFQGLLSGIQRGDLIDRFGWMRRLTEISPVHA